MKITFWYSKSIRSISLLKCSYLGLVSCQTDGLLPQMWNKYGITICKSRDLRFCFELCGTTFMDPSTGVSIVQWFRWTFRRPIHSSRIWFINFVWLTHLSFYCSNIMNFIFQHFARFSRLHLIFLNCLKNSNVVTGVVDGFWNSFLPYVLFQNWTTV